MAQARILLVLALGALLSGCGAELLAGGYGEVEAEATDDPGASQQVAAEEGPRYSAAPAALPQGTIEFTAGVSLVSQDGGVIPIGNAQQTHTLAVAASDTVDLGVNTRVPVGTYPRVRLTFSRVQVEVEQGLVIGDLDIRGTVEVDIGSQPLVVEVPAQVLVRQDERTYVLVDLNAAVWLAATDPVTRTVPVAIFRNALEVSTRR